MKLVLELIATATLLGFTVALGSECYLGRDLALKQPGCSLLIGFIIGVTLHPGGYGWAVGCVSGLLGWIVYSHLFSITKQ